MAARDPNPTPDAPAGAAPKFDRSLAPGDPFAREATLEDGFSRARELIDREELAPPGALSEKSDF